VMKVPITFTNSSGADVAAAMNVAPATSLDIFSAVQKNRSDINIKCLCKGQVSLNMTQCLTFWRLNVF
jgi:hypothetical protein